MAAKAMVEQARGVDLGRPTLWAVSQDHGTRIAACELNESKIITELKILKELQIGTVLLVAAAVLSEIVRIVIGR